MVMGDLGGLEIRREARQEGTNVTDQYAEQNPKVPGSSGPARTCLSLGSKFM